MDPFHKPDARETVLTKRPSPLLQCSRPTIMLLMRTLVIASARNEGPYLIEWIAYQRILGFDAVWIYSNDNTDHSDGLLQALDRNGVIRFSPNPVSPRDFPQAVAYRRALGDPDLAQFTWALVCDIDEYLVIPQDTVGEFIGPFVDADAVSIEWMIMSGGGKLTWEDGLTIDRFRESCRDQERFHPRWKSFFRPGRVAEIRPHTHLPIDAQHRHLHANGHPFNARIRDFRCAQMNHYFTRSLPELFWKTARGGGFRPLADMEWSARGDVKLVPFVFDRGETDLRIQVRREPLLAEMARIRSLPGVFAAEKDCIAVRNDFLLRFPDEHRGQTLRALANLPYDIPDFPIDASTRAYWQRFPIAMLCLAPPTIDSFALMQPFEKTYRETNILYVQADGSTTWHGSHDRNRPWSLIAGFPTALHPYRLLSHHRYLVWLMHPCDWIAHHGGLEAARDHGNNPQLRNLLGLSPDAALGQDEVALGKKLLRKAQGVGIMGRRYRASLRGLAARLNWPVRLPEWLDHPEASRKVPKFLRKDLALYRSAIRLNTRRQQAANDEQAVEK